MNEKVSVIIPAFNAEAFVRQAIESVLGQTFQDFEVLVVDDGSTDETANIARALDGKVRCISQENRGLSGARNRGIQEAKYDLIALLDADDYWLPEKLSAQVEIMRSHPEAVACFTLTDYIKEDGNTKGIRVITSSVVPEFEDLVEALLLYSCVIGPPSTALIRKSAFDEIGLFDTRFSQCADWDLWLRLTQLGEIVYVKRPLVHYRIHATNMSKNTPLLEQDTFGVLNRFFADPDNSRFIPLKDRCYSNHWMILSGCYLHAGKSPDAMRCLWQALRLHPQNIMRPLGMPWRWMKRLLVAST